MKTTSANVQPASYFEAIARELQAIADGVGTNPHLTVHFAERLRELAQQMHEDAVLETHSCLFLRN